jgi:diguanylate cyclase (GGDEF)-like protein/PAS domain S-box-containing protein
MVGPTDGAPTADALLEAMSEAVYAVDDQRTITYWSSAAELLTGYSATEAVGRRCGDNLLGHVDDAGRALCGDGCPLLATISDGSVWEFHGFLHHRAGHLVPVAIRTAALRSAEGAITGAVEVFHDDSRFRAVTDRLEVAEHEALTDPLTGIANRRRLEQVLTLRHYERERYNRHYAVVFVDIDHFKQFNERYGHDVGDEVLRLVASTLKCSTRPSDTAGRWGGDEFLLVGPVKDHHQAVGLAERVRHLVAEDETIYDDARITVTVSTGVAVARTDEPTKDLVNRASLAMSGSKVGTADACPSEPTGERADPASLAMTSSKA